MRIHFWVHWAKIHPSQSKQWVRWTNQKNEKARESTTSPISPAHTHRWTCNQTCQILAELVQGFWSLRSPKMTLLRWLGTSPLQQCTHFALTIQVTQYLLLLCSFITSAEKGYAFNGVCLFGKGSDVSLPTHLRRVENGTAAFGRLLKTHLFSEY